MSVKDLSVPKVLEVTNSTSETVTIIYKNISIIIEPEEVYKIKFVRSEELARIIKQAEELGLETDFAAEDDVEPTPEPTPTPDPEPEPTPGPDDQNNEEPQEPNNTDEPQEPGTEEPNNTEGN